MCSSYTIEKGNSLAFGLNPWADTNIMMLLYHKSQLQGGNDYDSHGINRKVLAVCLSPAYKMLQGKSAVQCRQLWPENRPGMRTHDIKVVN